ncbi:MarR family winged helix-turn-helix transcriptional regulator [Bdellovibrio sp. HCB209]|uniref:MarR family winged helix-turn-helix transcriptional regulator n=1 Tax=Bdellovibrio sp. HCB209 TaxID=3394354 RepID=UPI0039B5CC5C
MASRVAVRAYDSTLEDVGINVIQYSILINTHRMEPVPLARLAERLEMERTTLYRALAILEKNCWVKIVSEGEGISKSVSLTSSGTILTKKAETKWKKLHEAFVKKFGQDGLEQFNEMLSEVREYFKE